MDVVDVVIVKVGNFVTPFAPGSINIDAGGAKEPGTMGVCIPSAVISLSFQTIV